MSWLTSLRSALGLGDRERARQPTRTGRVVEELSLWRQFSRIGGGLTPGQVSAIVREADGGDPRRLMDLANEARQKDGHLQAVLGQSEETLAALPWQLVLHDDSRLKDRKARDWADQYLRTCPSFRRLIAHLAGATYYGFAVSEILWAKEDGRLVPSSFEPLAPRRFGFRQEDGLFVWRDEGMRRDGVDFRVEYPWKFVVSQPRVTGDVPCREGLVRVLMWAALFRNWTLTDWVRLGEIAWKPWRIGTYKKGAAQEDIDGLVNVLDGMSTNGVATVPDSVTVDVKWAPHSSTKSTHEVLFQTIGSEMSKAVLGQTETTEASQSSGLAQAKVHQSVRGDLLEARARCIAAELTRDVLAPMILLNFGDSAVVPEFQFVTQDKQDFKAFAEGVKSLKEAGTKIPQAWVREQAGIPEPQDGEELLGDPEIPVDVEEPTAPTTEPPPATAPDGEEGT